MENQIAFHKNEQSADFTARCGWCKAVVDGDATGTGTPSEAYAAHPDSFVRGQYDDDSHDYELFSCAEGEGCAK